MSSSSDCWMLYCFTLASACCTLILFSRVNWRYKNTDTYIHCIGNREYMQHICCNVSTCQLHAWVFCQPGLILHCFQQPFSCNQRGWYPSCCYKQAEYNLPSPCFFFSFNAGLSEWQLCFPAPARIRFMLRLAISRLFCASSKASSTFEVCNCAFIKSFLASKPFFQGLPVLFPARSDLIKILLYQAYGCICLE